MDFINQWLGQMDIAPIVGAIIIAALTIFAAKMVQLLGRKVALTISERDVIVHNIY
jgi:hypothetical protein